MLNLIQMMKDIQFFLRYDCLNWLVLYISEVKTFKFYEKYATKCKSDINIHCFCLIYKILFNYRCKRSLQTKITETKQNWACDLLTT